MRSIHGIVVHCTATRPDWFDGERTSKKVAEIKRWHLARGWSDIGYHYLIDRDGTIQSGRPIERTGAHVKGQNTGTIGVSLFGGHGSNEKDDFEENFTAEQDTALRMLLGDLDRKYGPDLKVTGHNEYAAKACPGFQVHEWISQAPLAAPKPDPAPAPAAGDGSVTFSAEDFARLQEALAGLSTFLEGKKGKPNVSNS